MPLILHLTIQKDYYIVLKRYFGNSVFECQIGVYISIYFVCDGDLDCPDGSPDG